MSISRLKALQEFIIREIFKDAPTGVMRTLPNKELVNMNVQVLAQRLMQGGIDPTALKNANQVENAINMIENKQKANLAENIRGGIGNTKTAKVFDLEGKEIPQGSKIIGGKAVKETEAEILARMNRENKEAAERIRRKQKETMDDMKDIEDPEDMAQGGRAGYRFGIGPLLKRLSQKNPKQAYTDYLESVKKRAKEGDVKSLAPELGAVTATGVFINRRMKDVLENMKNQDMENTLENFKKELDADPFYKEYPEIKDKVLENYTETMFGEKKAQGGRAGFDMGGAPSIVLNPDERERGKVFETSDVKEAIKEIIKRSIGPLDMAEIPLTEKGRLRFGFDSSGDRQISGGLDLLGGELDFGAGSGRQGKGIGFQFRKKFGPGAKGKRVNRKEGGGRSRRQFMKIMGGIASLPFIGKFFKGAKPAAKIAEVATKTPVVKPPEYFFDLAAKIKILGKESSSAPRERMIEVNYKNYSLQEDLVTGDMTIVKRKGDGEEVMALRKGQADEMTKGKTPPDEYEELTIRPDPEGKMKDVEDGIEPDSVKEIMEEVGKGGGNLDQTTLEEIARGRLASGGVAMMLGE